ncbi:MAG: ATP-binding cassette domain-containing protein [Verrucomicrobiota bacterium]|nr:ATP-binding cassette domain-containing protein [Verrucomicrobiota bacterium]
MAEVTFRNISFTAPKAEGPSAVTAIDLEVGDGEFAVVVGPALSGKSTLLRLLTGLEKPAQGEIAIGGRPVNDVPPPDRELAMVFHDYALFPQMTVRNNIAFGLTIRKFPKNEIAKRVQDAAAILEITELLDRKPAALTMEQRLRTALGRALVRQPKVFLFDEPLANLDPPVAATMRTELAKLHQRLGTTFVYTTRDPIEAMSLGDRLIVLRAGRVQQSASLTAIYDAPANLFVASFIGNPPMNLIHGSLKPERDGWLFRERDEGTIELRLPLAESANASALAGKEVVLGIRPEAIALAPVDAPKNSANTFPALLEVVESLGAESDLHLQTGAHVLVCRTAAMIDRKEAGRRMRLTINPAKTHLFDPVSTERIPPP